MKKEEFTVMEPIESIHAFVEQQAVRHPDAVAVVFGKEHLTRRDLDQKANKLAWHLGHRGFKPGNVVGICLHRSMELIVAMLAVLKAGGAYILIDPKFPPPQINHLLKEAGAALIIVNATSKQNMSEIAGTICLTQEQAMVESASAGGLRLPTNPAERACVLYTLGTTSASIVASLSHRVLVRLINESGWLVLEPEEHIAQSSPVWFNASTLEIWSGLIQGGRVIGVPDECLASPRQLAAYIEHQKVTTFFLPTDLFHGVVRETPGVFRSVRNVVLGGGLIDLSYAQEAMKESAARLVYMHALSDPAGITLWYEIENNPSDLRCTPVGRPGANTPMFVLDRAEKLTPIRITGELCLPVDPSFHYLGESQLHSERLVSNPYGKGSGGLLYKTGQQARYLADKTVEFLKHARRVALRRGARIDMREMESLILQNEGVHDVFVLPRKTEGSGDRLVAYIVPNGSFSSERLRDFLISNVAAPLIPDLFVPISSIPLTPLGQVDTEALSRVSVIDEEVVRRWEQSLETVSTRAAVIVQDWEENLNPWHVSDLLPSTEKNLDAYSQRVPEFPATDPEKCLTPAITQGPALKPNGTLPRTLTDALFRGASSRLGIHHIHLDGSETFQSYAELLSEAERVLHGMRKAGAQPQDKIIVQISASRDFFTALGASLLGGFVLVPLAVPSDYTKISSKVTKLFNVWKMLEKPLVLTNDANADSIKAMAVSMKMEGLRLETIESLRQHEADKCPHLIQPDDVAILFLTSGSTGIPKGVPLTHCNLISMAAGTAQANGFSSEQVTLNWMPLDHVGALSFLATMPIWLGCGQVHVAPELILREPLRWLDLIEKYQATISWAPNFAFGLIAQRSDAIARGQWKLESMRFLVSAGESVSLKTARRFLDLLKPHGLEASAFRPAFGMTETASGITWADRVTLNSDEKWVELGPPIPGASLRVVDHTGAIVGQGTIGNLQVKGPSVMSGYYKDPELNAKVLRDGWLETGDLAFLREGRLFIVGREKDLIIINGANYHGHELEEIVEEVDGIERSFVAACAVRNEQSDTDQLAIFFTPHRNEPEELLNLIGVVRARLNEKAAVNPDYLIPLPKERFPKTEIGKTQRGVLQKAFEAGEFQAVLKELDILSANQRTVPNWFYKKIWRRKEVGQLRDYPAKGIYVIFGGRSGLGLLIAKKIASAGRIAVVVEAGDSFSQTGEQRYTINSSKLSDYQLLFGKLKQDGLSVDHIIHLWCCEKYSGEISTRDGLEHAQNLGVFSLLFLVQSHAKIFGTQRVELILGTSHVVGTSLADEIAYEKATVVGLLKTIPLDLPWFKCRLVDLEAERVEKDASFLWHELCHSNCDAEVAYREDERLVSCLARVDMLQEETREMPIKREGLYLITGGLGGIGTLIADNLSRQFRTKLILIGRTVLPPRSEWIQRAAGQDRMARRIQSWQKLQAAGVDFIYASVDVCDAEALDKIVLEAEAKWGRALDGILHLAAEGDLENYWNNLKQHSVDAESVDTFQVMFWPKVLGTWALHEFARKRRNLSFISFSTVNSLFGGANFSAYAAANSFLDAYSLHQRNQSRPQTYNFNWSFWDGVGMSQGGPAYIREAARGLGYQAVSSEQGWVSFLGGLTRNVPQLIVGLNGTNSQIRRYVGNFHPMQQLTAYVAAENEVISSKWHSLQVRDAFNVPATCELIQLGQLPLTIDGEVDRAKLVQFSGARRRVSLADGATPRDELETQLTQMWQELLRLPKVGINDNFFERGGHSLLATQLMSRIKLTLGIDMPLFTLFESPTISGLADAIRKQGASEGQPLDPIVKASTASPIEVESVDGLSDEEVDRQLKQLLARENSK